MSRYNIEMKRFLLWVGSLLGVIVMVGMSIGGGCGWSAAKVFKKVIANEYNQSEVYAKVYGWCFRSVPGLGEIQKILNNKTFLVLLQNSNELRSTGGFMGSFAKIQTDPKGLKDIAVQDIYVPDGQLPGHVEPPYPIQEAFGQGWWKLRDANWDVDFVSVAGTVAWFFEQGGEKQVDGIVAINLEMIKKILAIYGPVKLVTYDETVSTKNVDQLAQKYAEVGFVPGSTQKRDFLGAVGLRLIEEIKQFDLQKDINVAKLIHDELQRGEVLVWMKDKSWQERLESRRWTGQLDVPEDTDYLYIIESNLGANKANCCVSKEVKQELGKSIQINWKNDNPFETPRPPIFWGGNYVNYVRVIIPDNSLSLSVRVNDKELKSMNIQDNPVSLRQGMSEQNYVIEKRDGLQIIGFWVVVEAGKTASATIEYQDNQEFKYLKVKRQPGDKPWKYVLSRGARIIGERIILRDEIFGL